MPRSGSDGIGVLPPAGWYEDPTCPSVVRYWDGSLWSPDQVRTASVADSVPAPDNASPESWPPVATRLSGEAADSLISGASSADDDRGYRIIESPPTPRQPWHHHPDPPVDIADSTSTDASNRRPEGSGNDAVPPRAPTELGPAPLSGVVATAALDETIGAPRPQSRHTRVRILTLAVLVAALLVGLLAYITTRPPSSSSTGSSGPPLPTTAPAPVPIGYHLNPIPAAGLSLAVRDTWLALDPTSTAFKSAVQRAAAANPGEAAILQQYGSNASSIKFFAADTSNPVFASNVQVTVLGMSKAALSDPTGAQAALRKEIPNAEVHPATIAGTRGLAMTGTLSFKLLNGAPVTMHATGYFVATPAGVVSIDFATADAGTQDADVQATMNSLRLDR